MNIRMTTSAAARAINWHQDRINEHLAGDRFPCAPQTSQGKARLFDLYDIIGLRLFKDLIDEGYRPERAGKIACAIAAVSRKSPEALIIAYVVEYWNDMSDGNPSGFAIDLDKLPQPMDFDELLSRNNVSAKSIKYYNISNIKKMVSDYVAKNQTIVIS